jgi:HAMP domain-containing protein
MTLPRFLNLKRLEGRIVALFLALLSAVQLTSFALIHRSIARNADASIRHELETGGRILQRLLVQDARTREDAARLLEKDHGFRSVLAEGLRGDEMRETLKDALISHGDRVKASLVAYTDAQGRLVAASSERAQAFIDLLPRLTAAGRASGTRAHLSLVDDRAYQVVVVPVGAAGLGGSVLMAFALDRAPLQELQRLSGLQSVLLLHAPDRQWNTLASTLDSEATASVARQAPRDSHQFALALGDESMRALYMSLLDESGQQLGVVLMRSFDEAVAPYRRLQLTLLGLTLLGVAVFALGSVLTAKRISEPIKALSESARRLGQGDYDTAVTRTSDDEIGDLAQAFEAMRRGIQDRERQVHRLAFWDPLTGHQP